MIRFEHKGDFSKTTRYFEELQKVAKYEGLEKYGERGVAALSSATPMDTGETSKSWSYKIEKTNKSIAINFYNSNVKNGVPIAIIIQYGHGTSDGGWVEGRDYINPAIQPVFDKITNDVWKEVTGL